MIKRPVDTARDWRWCLLAEPPTPLLEIASVLVRPALISTSQKSYNGTTFRPVGNITVPRLTRASDPCGPWCLSLSHRRLTAG